MTRRFPFALQLRTGDVLLYEPTGLHGLIIAIKTWHAIAHVEAYVGGGRSVASRDGIGVGEFELRTSELIHVLRPVAPFDFDAAMRAFRSKWQGQGYDWWGLLRFAWRAPVSAIRFENKQFCSEFLTRWLRAGGLDPFNGEDADAIAPYQFLLSDKFRVYDVSHGRLIARRERITADV